MRRRLGGISPGEKSCCSCRALDNSRLQLWLTRCSAAGQQLVCKCELAWCELAIELMHQTARSDM